MGIQKALAAFVTSGLVILTPFIGELSPEMLAGIQSVVGLLGTALVWFVSNKS